MKVIDLSGDTRGNKKNPLAALGSLGGRSWVQKEAESQDTFANALKKSLDNRYYLLRHVTLEGPDVPVPLLLVGPPGVRMIYASSVKGIYRAREDTWEELEERSQRFKPAKPNLLTRTELLGRAVDATLETKGVTYGEVEPVLFFSNPGVHIESARPIVRIVLMDAMERFIAGLQQSRTLLERDQIEAIVAIFQGEAPPVPPVAEKSSAEPVDAFSFREEAPLKPKPPRREDVIVVEDHPEPSFIERIPFTPKQWKVLGVLILVNILLLIAFVILILITT